MYLTNAWYVAAWDNEVKSSPVRRTILGADIVLFRDTRKRVHALPDSCPHRRLPLSMGKVNGDTIECGYHGMRFAGSGQCIAVPGQDKIPAAAHLRSFPIHEKWNLLWIWMGDPQSADPADIIDVPHYDDDSWAINRGPAMDVACHYQLMTDNLLDPSHVSYVHGTSLGNADTVGIPVKTEAGKDRVIVQRWILDHALAPFFANRVKFSGNADRLQHYELRMPSLAVIKDVIAPTGSGAPQGHLHEKVWLLDSYNFITPVDDNSCRYYWFQLRNYDVGNDAESIALTTDFIAAFNEDLVVLAAVQKGMKAQPSQVDLATDRGSNLARRMLKQMITAEQGKR